MKCLVTGARGFIGQHLVKALEKRGDEVYKLPRSFFTEQTFDTKELEKFSPDYIYHLAAYGNMHHQQDAEEMLEVNVGGLYNLLDITKNVPYLGFVNVSSSSVLLPHQTMYAGTKAAAEAIAKVFVSEYDKPIVTLRPFSVYGPGEADFRFIPTVFRSCMTGEAILVDPNPVHDWVYVDDFVNAMIEFAHTADVSSVVNVGTGRGYTNGGIVAHIEAITGEKANITEVPNLRSYDTSAWVAKPEDYLCQTTLKAGLEAYYGSIK